MTLETISMIVRIPPKPLSLRSSKKRHEKRITLFISAFEISNDARIALLPPVAFQGLLEALLEEPSKEEPVAEPLYRFRAVPLLYFNTTNEGICTFTIMTVRRS